MTSAYCFLPKSSQPVAIYIYNQGTFYVEGYLISSYIIIYKIKQIEITTCTEMADGRNVSPSGDIYIDDGEHIYIYPAILFVVCWLVGNETDTLHLTFVVKSNDPCEVFRVSLLALLNFGEDLSGVGTTKHG